MFQGLPRYESYVPAGEWIPSVPKSWGWEPARTIFSERKETDHVDEQMLSVTIGRGVIRQADLIANTAKKDSSNLDKSKYKLVVPGDLVYNKMRAWQGAAGESAYLGIVSPAYIVMTPRSGLTEYFHHVLRTPMFAKEAERWSYGITSDQWSLRPEHFKMIRFPVPPREEQAVIVKYLAHANARINKAITAKRRLIALLEEQKAVISANQLEGLTGSIGRLKQFSKIQTGLTMGKDYRDQDLREYPYLRVANVQMGYVDTREVATVMIPESEAERVTLREGDVLMTEGGDIDKLGRGTVWDGSIFPCLHQNHVFAVRCSRDLKPEFLALWLSGPTARDYFYLTAKKTTNLASTNSTTVRELPIVVPSVRDQARLVDELTTTEEPLNDAIRREQVEIALLQEFRTRLVADVVTGQVDVRGVAATLPDAVKAGADAADDELPVLDEELVAVVEGDDV